MTEQTDKCDLVYDQETSFLSVDGVKIGKIIPSNSGRPILQVVDKDKRRSARRGTRFVAIDLQTFTTFVEKLEVNSPSLQGRHQQHGHPNHQGSEQGRSENRHDVAQGNVVNT